MKAAAVGAAPDLVSTVKRPKDECRDDELHICRFAIQALGNIGPTTTEATGELTVLLNDGNPYLRAYAAVALLRIEPNSKEAIAALGKLLANREGWRATKNYVGVERCRQTSKPGQITLTAEGTRVTMTIPAGVIGNEQPLLTSLERWYSPELKAVLLIERSDPRFGRITWRLSRIERSDPVPAQFTVPGGFKIIPN